VLFSRLPSFPWVIDSVIVKIETDCDYFWELRTQPEPGAMPLARGRCTADMSDLVVEAYTTGVRADRLPADLATLHARIRPVWRQEPVVEGVSKRCGNCNQNPNCPLSESYPSLHDYDQLLAQLFPSKTTLLPIAGRKLGVEGRRPVLQIHAWHGGDMRPIPWATYEG
jgi:hypothetical protein